MIEAETVRPLLETLRKRTIFCVGKVNGSLPRKSTALSLHKSTNTYFLTTHSGSTETIVEGLLTRYPVNQKGTRNGVLMQLIGDLIHMFGREVAELIVREHYRRNTENIRTALDEHLREFATGWNGMHKRVLDSLSIGERQAFNLLRSEHQREGFLIVRAFAGVAEHKHETDFPIAQASLADRLNLTEPGAGCVIRKLCEEEVIAQTQLCVTKRSPRDFAGYFHDAQCDNVTASRACARTCKAESWKHEQRNTLLQLLDGTS